MSQRVEVRLTDDLTGTTIPVGKGETIAFNLDGNTYEIDLTNKNATALRKALAPYVSAGRPLKNIRGVRMKLHTVSSDSRTIKEWARANGYKVKNRGRIPTVIREAFEASH